MSSKSTLDFLFVKPLFLSFKYKVLNYIDESLKLVIIDMCKKNFHYLTEVDTMAKQMNCTYLMLFCSTFGRKDERKMFELKQTLKTLKTKWKQEMQK